jgi:hypothetical protein
MPNWVKNVMKVHGLSREEMEEMFLSIRGEVDKETGEARVIDFEKIIPMPPNIFRGSMGKEEWKIYGRNNWYDWSIENWDTKWNASNGYRHNDKCIVFDTAWSLPYNIYCELAKKYPKAIIEVMYADEDIGSNCGHFKLRYGTSDLLIFDYPMSDPKRFANRLWNNY